MNLRLLLPKSSALPTAPHPGSNIILRLASKSQAHPAFPCASAVVATPVLIFSSRFRTFERPPGDTERFRPWRTPSKCDVNHTPPRDKDSHFGVKRHQTHVCHDEKFTPWHPHARRYLQPFILVSLYTPPEWTANPTAPRLVPRHPLFCRKEIVYRGRVGRPQASPEEGFQFPQR